MELKIEYVPIESINPYKRNAKQHPKEQIDQIKRSMTDMGNGDPSKGFLDPVGVWQNTIVEGHGRYIAASELGLREIPIIRLDELTDEQRKEYALIHNQTTMNSGYDMETLGLELCDLKDFDAEFYGFELPEETVTATDDDYEPTVPNEPKAKRGDVYQLGEHRLMCGDSTSENDIQILMGGGQSRYGVHRSTLRSCNR